MSIAYNNPQDLAEQIRSLDYYDPGLCEAFCELAGEEALAAWRAADGDSFEDVLRAAAEILGVDIGI